MNFNINDPNFLPWLIPVGPLLGFLIITLLTNRSRLLPATSPQYGGHHPDYGGMPVPVVTDWSRAVSIIVGMSGIVMAWLISLAVVGNAFSLNGDGVGGKLGQDVHASALDWMATGLTQFRMGVLVDPLTTIMLIMVPLACLMIFIYSIGYMANDPRQARFFSLIALFAGAMLTLVVADNLLLLFVGWEVMGLCSYMLIGFWFEKPSAYKAAIKAFTTTRIADVIMLLGIAYLFAETGTLSFREIVYNAEVLEHLATTPAVIFSGLSAAGLIGIFLIIGTVGKSAQFPLHVWLPDAMEGPTPVSAMIHAAAMVSAGIYALIRMYPLFEIGGHPHDGEFTAPLMFMAVVGSVTALFAATIAVAQNDVKKVLAYSTISQLGFMVAALGIGAYIAATFHLITHAFFKALLFMASGAVIHGMEHGEHHVHAHAHAHGHDAAGAHDAHAGSHDAVGAEHGHDSHADATYREPEDHAPRFDPQDMMNMGGLRKTMPVTFITFLIGGLSLAGFPLITAGFWSKDEILADAWHGLTEGFGPHTLVFIFLALAAFLTAFYTARQLCLTFLGEPRTEEAKHANLGEGVVSLTMTLPLIVLAVFAIFAGFVGVNPGFPVLGGILSPNGIPFKEFLKYTLIAEMQPSTLAFDAFPVLVSFVVALGGLGLGYLMYGRKPLAAGEPDPLINLLSPSVHNTLRNKYYFDELYIALFVKPSQWFSKSVAYLFIDKGVIDGFLHLIARVFTWIGDFLKVMNAWLIDGLLDGVPELVARFGFAFRWIQTGRIQQYLLLVAVMAIVIAVVFALSAGGSSAAVGTP